MSQAITLLSQPAAAPVRRHKLAFASALLPLALLVLPLAAIVPMSFTATDIIALPPDRWGFAAYSHLWTAPGWGQALLASLEVAAAAAVLAVIAGTAAAIGISRLHGAAAAIVTALVLAPLALPVVVMGLAQFEFFARLRLNGTLAGIALAHGVLGVPYVFLTMRAALARLDSALIRAAQSLGAGAWPLLRWVYLPVLFPAVLAGTVLAYSASLEEVVIALFLSGPRAITLPVKLFTECRYNLSPIILAVATLLMAVVLVFGLIVRGRRRHEGPQRTPRGYDSRAAMQTLSPAAPAQIAGAKAQPGSSIVVDKLGKSFGHVDVLNDISFTLLDGEFLTLLGSSGSGKTTTLGIIAGFIEQSSGDVRIGGRSMTGVPPRRRNLGVVFQNYALFPHLTVLQNVEFGLRMRNVPAAERRKRAMAMLRRVALERVAGSPPGAAFRRTATACRPRPGAQHRPGRAIAR